MAKSDQVTGNIGLTDALGATTVQPSGMPRRYSGGSRGGSPLAHAALGAVEQGIKLIPMAMKASKEAAYHSMYAELATATEGWIADELSTTRRRGERSKLRKKWGEEGRSNELINRVFAAKPPTSTKDRTIGGRTMLFDPQSGSRLGNANNPSLQAVDDIATDIGNNHKNMVKSTHTFQDSILRHVPEDDKRWAALGPTFSTHQRRINTAIADTNINALFENVSSLDDYKLAVEANGNRIKNALYDSLFFLASKPIAEMFNRPGNAMTMAGPGVTANALFSDIFQKFRDNPALHKASGISMDNLLSIQQNMVAHINQVAEFATGKGSAAGTAAEKASNVLNLHRFKEMIGDHELRDRWAKSGNKELQAYATIMQKDRMGFYVALNRVADIFMATNDQIGLTRFKQDMFNEETLQMRKGMVDNLINDQINKNANYTSLNTRDKLETLLQGPLGISNDIYQDKLVKFTTQYIIDLRESSTQKGKEHLEGVADSFERMVAKYQDRIKKATNILDATIKGK